MLIYILNEQQNKVICRFSLAARKLKKICEWKPHKKLEVREMS